MTSLDYYRKISSELAQAPEHLFQTLLAIPRKCSTLLVGIDGCGGSGKSTLAENIRLLDPDAVTVVHMDDFILSSQFRPLRNIANKQIGADIDWVRLKEQVIQPLVNNMPASYQRYDWLSDSLADQRPRILRASVNFNSI